MSIQTTNTNTNTITKLNNKSNKKNNNNTKNINKIIIETATAATAIEVKEVKEVKDIKEVITKQIKNKTHKNNKNIINDIITNDIITNDIITDDNELIELQNTNTSIILMQQHPEQLLYKPDGLPTLNINSNTDTTNTTNTTNITNSIDIDIVLNTHQKTFGTNKQQLITYHIVCKVLEHYNKSLIEYNNTLTTIQHIIIPNELLENMLNTISPDIIKNYNKNIKPSNKKTISETDRCEGRKLDNTQCSRSKYIKGEGANIYCKSHKNKLSNGSINSMRIETPQQQSQSQSQSQSQTQTQSQSQSQSQSQTQKQTKTQTQTQTQHPQQSQTQHPQQSILSKSRRGRKRKVVFDPRRNDNEYITVWEDLIDGHKVLIDNKNNIYTFDIINPVYLGKKTLDFKIDETKLNTNTTQLPILTPIIA